MPEMTGSQPAFTGSQPAPVTGVAPVAELDDDMTMVTKDHIKCGDFRYQLREDGTAMLTGYLGKDKILKLPETLDDRPVTAIRYFENKRKAPVTRMIIPDCIQKIASNPGFDCPQLEAFEVSVDHPTLAVIDGVLFEKEGKTLVAFPPGKIDNLSVKTLGSMVAGAGMLAPTLLLTMGAIWLASRMLKMDEANRVYTVPDGIKTIGYAAFAGCKKLTGVNMPSSVTCIRDKAFTDCDTLREIRLPDELEELGGGLGDNPKLTTIYIKENHPHFKVVDGVIYDRSGKTLISYLRSKPNTEFTVPYGVEEISGSAFSSCIQLKTIHLPQSVVSIGSDAFLDCRGLEKINIPNRITTIQSRTFCNCSSLLSLKLPENVQRIGFSAFQGCTHLSAASLPQAVQEMGDGVFAACSSLENMEIDEQVTALRDYMFYSCSKLNKVVVKEGAASIGEGCFAKCEALTSVVLPQSVTYIADDAFAGCSKELVVTVPKGSYAAAYCKERGLTYTYPDLNEWLKH